jgi:hypothetical protein
MIHGAIRAMGLIAGLVVPQCRRAGYHVLALLFVLAAAPSSSAQQPPTLKVYAPADLAAAEARVKTFDPRTLAGIVRTVGLAEPGPPIDVVLAAENSEAAKMSGPEVAGYALGRASLVVLFPSRSPRYPHDTLEDVLRHEVAHVLVDRAAGGRQVPRWFNEGLAMAIERPWGLQDRSRLVWELAAGPRLSLREIDALFSGAGSSRARAYSLSAAVVRDLIAHHGGDAPARVLRLVREGAAFDDAIATVAGRPLGAVEDAFWQRQRVWTVWVPLFTSDHIFWIAVILLAALAVWRRRRQSAAIRRRWAEEPAEDAAPRDDRWHRE